MGDIKFSCPSCKQEIECDELWGGHDLACPTCNAQMTVPQLQSASAPVSKPAAPAGPVAVPTGAAPRLSIGGHKPQQQAAAPQGAAPTGRPGAQRPAHVMGATPKGGAMKWVKIAAVVVILAVGGYFGFGLVKSWQDKADKKMDAAAKNSDGGEAGHIAGLYSALDATDPDKRGAIGSRRGPGTPSSKFPAGDAAMAAAQAASGTGTATTGSIVQDPPGTPPVWSLEMSAAKIPEGGANGSISGAPFVVQTARIDPIGTAHVLSLKQGAGPVADHEVLIYLHLAAGETLGGKHWLISQDMRPPAAPQIIKRWKTDPKYAAQQNSYPGGYSMKLDLGSVTESNITGKIYLALPDQQQSVVAGSFKAVIGAPVPVAQQMAAPAVTPMAPNQNPSRDASFNSRYGIKR
jgi:hypothetical protein